MDRATKRTGTAGLSLVELLVVLGIIGILSAVLIPTAIKNGWSSSNKTALAAREIFTLAKAARVYASTYNVETALVYGVSLVQDSEDGRVVPVATEVALARRIKRDEIVKINDGRRALGITPLVPAGTYFVPLGDFDGGFRTIPKDMCILSDLFEVDDISDPDSIRGLRGVQLYDAVNHEFFTARTYDFNDPQTPGDPLDDERLDYSQDGVTPNFPAHRFLPDGSLNTLDTARQRLVMRVGARPDAQFKDRFTVPTETQPVAVEVPAVFYTPATATPPPAIVYVHDEPDEFGNNKTYPAEVDTPLEFFVPTGRVRMTD